MTDRIRIVLATRNDDKIGEISRILADIPVGFLSLKDFPDVEPAAEDGSSFEENALKKSLAVWEQTGQASLADDSGLEVEALDGRPGIMSARFAGEPVSYEANNRKLVELLRKVAPEERKAKFVCVASLVTPKGKIILQRGEVKGLIIDEPRGTGGFGYDPIFYIPRLKKTMAELEPETKNSISHRAKAFEGMKSFILKLCAP